MSEVFDDDNNSNNNYEEGGDGGGGGEEEGEGEYEYIDEYNYNSEPTTPISRSASDTSPLSK